jgi:tetratricopeptide (TPR) repeat protein
MQYQSRKPRGRSDACVMIATLLLLIPLEMSAYQAGALTITTEPNASVWIDDIRRGSTDASGKLVLTNVSAKRHAVRIRAVGFKESTTSLLPGRRTLAVKLVPTTDKAELLFQQAEIAREKARDDAARQKAIELYEQAIKVRSIPGAHVGLARIFMDQDQFEKGLSEIDAARRTRPAYAEASAVEGRIYRESGFPDDAIKSYRRAIREAGGFQPEAHVGLARVWEEKGEFNSAVAEYKKALDQLADSEPIIYQLLGAAYERLEKPKEAVVAYEKYLQLAPNGSLAPAIRSILTQLKREAAGEQIIP